MKPQNLLLDSKNQEAFDIVEFAVETYKKDKPFVIGITGAGGPGKTTFGKNIECYYGPEMCISIDLDDYLISREMRGKLEVSGYNPKSNKLYAARKNIEDLKTMKTIQKPNYNHATGKVLPPVTVGPKELIIIEGVTTLYPELIELYDLSFFLDAKEETQLKSRIERDVNQRGYTIDEALSLFHNLKPEYEKFIAPTKNLASVVFDVGPDYIMHPTHIDKKFKET
tara:strand:- start:1238 stop:1912 length:675 start_codon:yes stop_codon:yes gene_type:complete